jgi:hypothetical protein
MPFSAGPNIAARPNLVFEYDLGDVQNSYKGEPTTNVMRQSNNVTGTQYGYNDEYSTSQLVKTWYPNLITPIGTGATLLSEQNAGASFYYCLNWFDDSEDGKRCLSAYIYPLTSGITNFTIGMIADPGNSVIFNLDTGATTVGAGLSNANAFYSPVPGAPGWYRIGANIDGRVGGWVAGIGLGLATSYTPSAPFKSFYICGVQYERNIATHCTQFTQAQTTRSSTQGLLDISGYNRTINLSSVSFTSTAQMTFDGTDDYIPSIGTAVIPAGSSPYTVSVWVNRGRNNVGYEELLAQWTNANSGNSFFFGFNNSNVRFSDSWNDVSVSGAGNTNVWMNLVGVNTGANAYIYLNGALAATKGSALTYTGTGPLIMGRQGELAGEYFLGRMNNVQIYNSALSAQQVLQNYNQLKTRFNIT